MGGRKPKVISAEEETSKSQSPEKLSKAKSASGGKIIEVEKETSKVKVSKRAKAGPKKVRGKKHQEAKKKIELRAYPIAEAVKLVKEASTAGFDASIDVHINLGLEKDKAEQQLRSFLALPYGTGKSVKVLVFAEGTAAKAASEAGADQVGDDAVIESIAQGKLPAADAVVATPAFMPKLARIARFLGPKGLMPTPKAGTVTENPAELVGQLKQGRVEIKTEAVPIVHLSIGKVSTPDENLIANLKAIISEINRLKPPKVQGNYILAVFLAPTMGPSVKVDLASLS